jgi:TRAP-type mannitol/chloroaromatic compound transport system substrate-binding protein
LSKAYKSLLTIACGYANMDVQARYDARNPQAIKRQVAMGHCCARSARPSWKHV